MNEIKAMPELQELSDQVGEFVYYWGFKRIHGKIWTHLYLADQPLDAAELVKRLNISKALVSISIRELLDYEVVLLAGKSPRGTQLYRTNPDILSVILAVLRQRERRILNRVEAAFSTVDKVDSQTLASQGLSKEKVHQLGALIGTASVQLESLIALKAVDFGDWAALFGAVASAGAHHGNSNGNQNSNQNSNQNGAHETAPPTPHSIVQGA